MLKTIELHNPSKKPVKYDVTIQGSDDFILSQEEVEREGVETKLSGTEAAFDRLEATLRSTEAEYEAHVLSASAASVLIAKRLAMLGVGPEA